MVGKVFCYCFLGQDRMIILTDYSEAEKYQMFFLPVAKENSNADTQNNKIEDIRKISPLRNWKNV